MRSLDVSGEIEKDVGVARPILQDLNRGVITYDFCELGQAHELPPSERIEPEQRAVERRQQQHIEVTVSDVRGLMRQHRPALGNASAPPDASSARKASTVSASSARLSGR